ncbi:unnamed protein product [Strongylus vulgaris]|uniref:Uncharacterized protein n=1 Tax=Strongylus vulgaris TaxID=40348 RepID=A0A3P7JBU6_STRVU|nr:unnamed protein product [Strongylus vulgaris]
MTSHSDSAEEDAVASPADELSSSNQGVEPVSRRRLAFRPPLDPQPQSAIARLDATAGECPAIAGVCLHVIRNIKMRRVEWWLIKTLKQALLKKLQHFVQL